jgi:hypothetical protein
MTNKPSPDEAIEELLRRRQARADGGAYREYVSGLKVARHSRFLWDKLHDVMEGRTKRLMVFMPPGSAKTTDVSHHFPAFYLSKYPQYPIIGTTHTDKFAEANGRRVRNIIMSDEHRTLFPDVSVREDSSAAARWELTNGGMYMGFGVGATVVGRRAGGLILDDVVAGIAAADSQTDRDFVWSWYGADLATRLIPGGWIILVMTRYHPDDIAGRLLAGSSAQFGDKWEVLSLPAMAKANDPLGREIDEPLWPEWQSKKELIRIKNQPSMTSRLWSALYQQEPVVEAGNIIKRNWFQLWKSSDPPTCNFIIQSWDTATTKKEHSAYSCCLTFGVFTDPKDGMPSMILLSRWRERVEYPELKAMARRLYHSYLDDRRDMPKLNPAKMSPDLLCIEDESSGKALIQEFARAGIRAFPFPARKYGSKDERLRLSMDILADGRVYVPAMSPNYTLPRKFADEFITSLTAYPASTSRDDVDALSMAIIKLKTSGWVYQSEDKPPEPAWRDTSTEREAIY